MRALAIVGTTIVGAAIGGVTGALLGLGQDDLQQTAAVYGVVGLIAGGLTGCVVGAAVFAR